MLDEIREQRLLVRDLCIERVLIAGARALYGAGMARRGNRQLRSQPGFFLPVQGNLFRLLDHGEWSAASGGGWGQIAAGGDGDFGLGIIAVSGWLVRAIPRDAASSGIHTEQRCRVKTPEDLPWTAAA
ncbi:hypothetical protein INR38_22380 [Delftia sp. SD018]|uniref:hypothetical protein n=1 Tax=Delftia sp. SD018 TaxID=2781389 RepID=UPI001A959A5B|nr:hypothetical protein [Delftia sp. SD018]MBO1036825.1 hypothetical protein [Delftia sp. SD018]